MEYLRTYASHADHPHAPPICGEARRILESAARTEESGGHSTNPDGAQVSSPAAADHQGSLF